jgi:hypothetical protein
MWKKSPFSSLSLPLSRSLPLLNSQPRLFIYFFYLLTDSRSYLPEHHSPTSFLQLLLHARANNLFLLIDGTSPSPRLAVVMYNKVSLFLFPLLTFFSTLGPLTHLFSDSYFYTCLLSHLMKQNVASEWEKEINFFSCLMKLPRQTNKDRWRRQRHEESVFCGKIKRKRQNKSERGKEWKGTHVLELGKLFGIKWRQGRKEYKKEVKESKKKSQGLITLDILSSSHLNKN